MKNNINERSLLYKHITVEGTSYQVGTMIGQYMITDSSSFRNITSNILQVNKNTVKHIEKAIKYFDKYCPGINDEISGVADVLGIDMEQIIYYINTYRSRGGCSQMAVLPGITVNGHIYAARNYEYRPQESDLCLITTKVKGKASHIGFSELMFGRNDGINENGLFISMSNAAPGITSNSVGVDFWAVIRSVLDSCKNVEQAIETILNMPTSCYTNFIVADRNSDAALIEVADCDKTIHNINNLNSKKYLCASNHFISSDMLKYDNGRYWDSVARYRAMELRINEAIPMVDKDILKSILTDLMPFGTCCHHYTEGFGTLWSVIYDITDINMEICFGSPRVNKWYTFDLNYAIKREDYFAVLPNENKKIMWKKLPPGANECSEFEIVK